jgi:hypothetical protein
LGAEASDEFVEVDVADVRRDIETQELFIARGRAPLARMIGMTAREVSSGPVLREVLKGRCLQ